MARWFENFGPWVFKTGISLLFLSYFAGIFFDFGIWETAIANAVEIQDPSKLPWPKDYLEDQLLASLKESPLFGLKNKIELSFQIGVALTVIGLFSIFINPKNFLYRTSKFFIYFGGLNYIGSIYSLKSIDGLIEQAVLQMQIPDKIFQGILAEILKTLLSNILDGLIYYSGVILLLGLIIFFGMRLVLKYPEKAHKKEKGE